MKKRTLRYLSGTLFISTVPTVVGTQQVFAKGGSPAKPQQQPAKPQQQPAKPQQQPATPQQQKEIVDYCFVEAQRYWITHNSTLALQKMFQPINDKTKTEVPDKIDLEYEKYFQDKSLRTFDNELELAEKLYNDALKNPEKEWDCKVVSGHMSNYLTSEGIKHMFVRFNSGKGGHAAIMYAVKEPSKLGPNKMEENWYILDMARVVAMVLTQIFEPGQEMFNQMWELSTQSTIKDARDAAKIPLISYSEWKYGFQNAPIVYVVNPNSTQSLRPKTWVPYDAISLGDYLVKNSPEFAGKYLILEVAGTDRESLQKNKNGEPVLKSRRWLREIEVQPKPTFYRTFNMEVSANGQRLSIPGCTIPYDEEIFFAVEKKNISLNNA